MDKAMFRKIMVYSNYGFMKRLKISFFCINCLGEIYNRNYSVKTITNRKICDMIRHTCLYIKIHMYIYF